MKSIVKVGLAAVAIIAAVSSGYLYAKRGAAVAGAAAQEAHQAQYTCPMHPFIVKAQPSTCPICGMELVKKGAGAGVGAENLKQLAHVALSPAQQVMANVETFPVAVQRLTREIPCTGVVSFNQEKQGKVAAWVGGRLERLLVKSVGIQVRKGQPVAELFSQDLYNAELQYLMAYKTVKILNSSLSVTFPLNTQMSLGDAHDRLRQLGFKEPQFDELQKTGKPTVRVPIHSPFSGVVTEKFVQEGQYVNTGEALFSIADLSPIWVDLEIFETDFQLIRVGHPVTIFSQSYPGQAFTGKVNLIYPFLDPKTRTVKLRVEIPNPGHKLKPEMYVTASIKAPLADSLVVPIGAVVDTGKRQVVWVEAQPGVFRQREVRIGARSDKGVQILSGLTAGEKVAVSGGYLIDSEAQLAHGEEPPVKGATQAGLGATPARPAATPAKSAVPAAAPGAKGVKDDMDMGDMKMIDHAPHDKH
jgi:membrane fusion protein, copper/silver efflux system